ncbi:hypothetical protein N7492_003492 [Penicillium capsulatum]|uniref:Uncharacterized protein n=1 Tax=Penicillium capsulatum TaxID=69766 RepID=A0A9W9IM35_9EURO|nr:hypothetical protein N7492_003492 [Penicillium capsulatum]
MTNGLLTAFKTFGDNAINQPAWNPPVASQPYYVNETGIVSLLQGGTFAVDGPDSVALSQSLDLNKHTLTTVYAGALNVFWKDVYIVNMTSISLMANYSDIEWLRLNVDPSKKFWEQPHNAQTFGFIYNEPDVKPSSKWKKPPGLDQLEILGLNLTGILASSIWFQNRYGFGASWSTNDTLNSYTRNNGTDRPPNDIHMTLPVCQLAMLKYEYNTDGISNECDMHVSAPQHDSLCLAMVY